MNCETVALGSFCKLKSRRGKNKKEMAKTRHKSYKFRLYPNKKQIVLFEKTFGCSRFIWNQMLADKIAYYKETGKTLKNTPAQYKRDYP